MKAVPVSAAGEGGTELHLFGNSAGQAGVEFGLKAFFIVEEPPWAKHFGGHSASEFRLSVIGRPGQAAFGDSLPCRGCDRCDAPTAAGPKPE